MVNNIKKAKDLKLYLEQSEKKLELNIHKLINKNGKNIIFMYNL